MNNNTIWINDLDKLVNEYNNSYHRSIKLNPIDASKKSNENIVRNNLYNFKITNKNQNFQLTIKYGYHYQKILLKILYFKLV